VVGEGVVGYTLKDATAVEIAGAIRAVARGEAVCPPCLSLVLFQCAARSIKRAAGARRPVDLALSRREQQLVRHLALGMTNKEIACKLSISDQTVKNHVHSILRKLGAKDRQMIAELWGAEFQVVSTDSIEGR
jgi:two-component system nitrate/nitrite response regulator NarL